MGVVIPSSNAPGMDTTFPRMMAFQARNMMSGMVVPMHSALVILTRSASRVVTTVGTTLWYTMDKNKIGNALTTNSCWIVMKEVDSGSFDVRIYDSSNNL